VAQPCYEIGVTAARMLLDRIDDPTLPRQVMHMACELRIRDSVRTLPNAS